MFLIAGSFPTSAATSSRPCANSRAPSRSCSTMPDVMSCDDENVPRGTPSCSEAISVKLATRSKKVSAKSSAPFMNSCALSSAACNFSFATSGVELLIPSRDRVTFRNWRSTVVARPNKPSPSPSVASASSAVWLSPAMRKAAGTELRRTWSEETTGCHFVSNWSTASSTADSKLASLAGPLWALLLTFANICSRNSIDLSGTANAAE
mmetsp:Transcript_38630/g.111087  ORF Transcript_38630/g.111087 Transcript_38630/m.111087 type:complete len:208 (-) Transcript_38630:695-1318(-)